MAAEPLAQTGADLTVLYIEDNLSNLQLAEDIPVAILSADARPALIERLLAEGVRGS